MSGLSEMTTSKRREREKNIRRKCYWYLGRVESDQNLGGAEEAVDGPAGLLAVEQQVRESV